jgi:4-amino-4-deoxy-L-arabinose transferase-like glycosyltransferase
MAWLAAHPPAAAAAALFAILLPVLFKHPAESGDPVEYYNAARCVADQLVCVAHDHWSARWPVFAPTGLLFGLGGESRATLGLFPTLHALAAVALFAAILQRCFGREAALAGGLLYAAMPLTSELAMQLNADMLELCFLLGATLALLAARGRGGSAAHLLLAGALFGLAVETRTTAVVTAGTIGAALLFFRWPPRSLVLIAAGGAAVLAASGLWQWAVTGDPLHGFRLALSHTKVPTTALPPGTDTSGSPFFNLELIRNWDRDVAVHWTIDPLLNQLASAGAGILLCFSAILFLLGRKAFAGAEPHARALRGLAAGAAAIFVTIAFVLSIHPTPRMFLPAIAAVVAMAAILVTGPRRDLRPLLLYALVPLLMLQSLGSRLIAYDPIEAETLSARWLAETNAPVSTDWLTHRHLNQEAAVRALPRSEGAEGLRLVIANGACETSSRRRDGDRIVRSAVLQRSSDRLIGAFEALGLVVEADPWSLCLYER